MNMIVASEIAHSAHSSTREKVIEHLFVGELLRCLWRKGVRDIEVLRAEVDKGGYDIVLEANGIIRHVQLKSSHRTAKTSKVGINITLARKPSGCVVWIQFDSESMELGPFLWFGGEPGASLPPLGAKMGKQSKGDSTGFKAPKPSIRLLKRTQFAALPTIGVVARQLFGL